MIQIMNCGAMDPNRESGLGSDSDNMAELTALLTTEIPDGRSNLADSHTNLERVAEYCEGNYFQSDNKRAALEETKNYTTQSLASVAYQINTLAYNFLQLLDLQTAQLAEMESQMNHIAQTVMIHKEKVARREIGVLTANKTTTRQYKIIAPANPEKPIKYVRKPIDYTALDDIGHGVRTTSTGGTPRSKQRGSSQGSIQSLGSVSATGMGPVVGPAPTTKPPTPPQVVRTGGSLSKGSREYRTPPAVAPPQVPSHYAPNYPLGHPRRGERGAGYSTLPMPPSVHMHSHTLPHHTQQHVPHPSPPMSPPQVGMVHPIPHNIQQTVQSSHPQTPPPPPPPNSYTLDHHSSMPPPPSPLSIVINSGGDTVDHGSLHHLHHSHTLPHHHAPAQALHHQHRPGNASPPLPPPPPPEDEHAGFGRPHAGRMMPIVPDEEDLPGWVPKNYIEKVVAIYDYYADKEDELSFQESSVIYVLKKNDDGWWEGVMDGITGLFPGNYVEPCV
ncbi:abl interactor 2-like isoform X1 [Zootermopsis nevadensis]|uniref:Abl interactor 2 n=2 Tax=Zootermopsis nevadensis TaxID=136037 RepID=A0A067QTN8_ZOONE|nr:abl interactor 2-like isoform X1 [Zootermopsis nevadensis]KDR07257.1 Abl interactor 2 [Zootermopsis nevadensis]